MARPITAHDRLRQDVYLPITMTILIGACLLGINAAWPHPADDGWDQVAPGLGDYLFASLLIVPLIAVIAATLLALWRRFGRHGSHYHDRWQAHCGELVDHALSGATFRTASATDYANTKRAFDGGFQAMQAGASVANLPAVGAAGGPLAVVGLATMGIAAVFGTDQAIAQHRRDQEATRIARGHARALLMLRRDTEQQRAATVRTRRAHRHAIRRLNWTLDAIARIDRLGYAHHSST